MSNTEARKIIEKILERVTGGERELLEDFSEYVLQVEETITKVLHLFADNHVPLAVGLAACESILQSFEKDKDGILKRAAALMSNSAKEDDRTIN